MRGIGSQSIQTRESCSTDRELAFIVDEFAERLLRGERVGWRSYYRRYRKIARELKKLGPTIELLAKLGRATAGPR